MGAQVRALTTRSIYGANQMVLSLLSASGTKRRFGNVRVLHRCFGELPILHEGLRSATVMADGELIYPTP